MTNKPYKAKFTSFRCANSCLGNDSYNGFRVLKAQKNFRKLLKIREATFRLPSNILGPFFLKTYTTTGYWTESCPEIKFRKGDNTLTMFKAWLDLDPEVRGIDWPRNNPRYYDAKVIPQNNDGSKVEIRIVG